MIRRFDLKTIVFFVALTVTMTIGVIAFWEVTMRPTFFAWVDRRYPGDVNTEKRWNIKQRTEHVFISIMVDALVVTLLLRLVHRQQRQLRESEERYRALFEQARDGIGVVQLADYRLVEANDKFCEILGLRQQDCAGRDVRELFPAPTGNAQSELLMVRPFGHSSGETELTVQTPQGQFLPVSLSLAPLSTDGEKLMIISLRDLSMR